MGIHLQAIIAVCQHFLNRRTGVPDELLTVINLSSFKIFIVRNDNTVISPQRGDFQQIHYTSTLHDGITWQLMNYVGGNPYSIRFHV